MNVFQILLAVYYTHLTYCWASSKLNKMRKKPDNTSELLNHLLDRYDKQFRPDFGEKPTLVDVNMNIRSMGPITEANMAYQLDCYFRQSWVDKRLKFEFPGKSPVKNELSISNRMLDKIWKPDTHFFNGKHSYLHTVTFPNKFIRLRPDGRILYSMRLTIQASCPMRLENFPMDVQTCPLTIISQGYTESDLKFVWTYPDNADSIVTASDMTLSQFDLIGWSHKNETKLQSNDARYYSVLSAEFRLRRHTGYFLINLYVPCSLMVVISWVAFWINREATSDRIALGVTTVLTMAFLGLDNRNDLPKVSYSTALDYFVATCFVCVLGSIIEFAAVHYFTKHGSGEEGFGSECSDTEYIDYATTQNGQHDGYSYKRPSPFSRTSPTGRNGSIMNLPYVPCRGNYRTCPTRTHGAPPPAPKRHHSGGCLTQLWHCIQGNAAWQEHRRHTPGVNSVSRIDQVSRVIFPISFITFHVVYWTAYLDMSTSASVFATKPDI